MTALDLNRISIIGFLVLGACQGEEIVVENEGLVCLKSSEGGDGIHPDLPLLVTVQLDRCLSASCHTERKAECQVTINGDSIEVTSRFSYTHETWRNTCTLDCGQLIAECEAELIDEGIYDAFHGETELGEVPVPYEESAELCFEE